MAQRKPRKRAYNPPEHEVANKRERTRSKPGRGRQAPARGAGGRRQYSPEPPTWRRTLRRVPVYFLLLFALQFLLNTKRVDDKAALAVQSAIEAAMVMVAFVPAMYLMERWQYTRWLRQQAGRPGRGATDDER